MRIAVVGSIVADTIEHADGTVTESLGGIAHTLAALAAAAGGAHTIVPVCRVGADCRDRVRRWAGSLPGLSLDAVIAEPDDNPRVHLSYPEAALVGERIERLSHSLAPLGTDDVGACLDADLVMVNCITGDDCRIEALRMIAGRCDRIYLDVHSLALGRADDGTRYYRGRDDWHEWLAGVDVVQCNEREAACICGREQLEDGGFSGVEDAVQELMRTWWAPPAAGPGGVAAARRRPRRRDERPPGVVLLTLADRGATVVSRARGVVSSRRLDAPEVEVVDPTGAGDAFGAGYVCAWLRGCGPLDAARAAVGSGSAACSSPGVPGVNGSAQRG